MLQHLKFPVYYLWFRGVPDIAECSLFEEMRMKADCVVNGHLL